MGYKLNFNEIENRFSMLLKSIPIPALLWKKKNNSLTLVNSNEESLRISGGKIKEYIGKKASEIFKNNSQILEKMQECALNNRKFILTENNGNPIVKNGISYNISFELIAPDTIIQYFTVNSSVNEKMLKNDPLKKNGVQNQAIQQATLDCLCNAAPMGIGMVVDRTIVRVNHKFCDLVGYDEEDLLNKSARILYPTDEEYEQARKEKYDLSSEYEIETVETQFRRKDGKIVQVLLSSALIDSKNTSLGAIFTALDLTKTKLIEKELITKDKRFHELVDMLPLVVFEIDLLGNLSFVNEKGFELFGYSPEDLANGFNAIELLTPTDRKRALINMVTSSKEGNLGGVEYQARKINGDLFPVLVYSLPIISDEKHIGFRGTLIDITAHKNREEKLKESEEKYRLLSEYSDDFISLYDEKFNMIYINAESHSRILGYPAKKFLKLTSKFTLVHKDDLITFNNIVKKGVEEGKYKAQIRFKHREGHYLWFQVTAKFFGVDSEKRKLLVVARNITDIKQFEQNLRESEEKYRLLSEYSDDFITLYDEKFNMTYINAESHSRVLGYPAKKFLKASFKNIIAHKDDVIPLINIVKKGIKEEGYRAQIRFKHLEGHYLWFEITAKFFGVESEKRKLLVVARNITDIKQVEENLKESEEKFRTIAEQSFMGIIIIQDGLFKYFNQRAADINGYSVKEIQNWAPNEFAKLIHPEDRDFVIEQARKKQNGEVDVINRHTYRIIKKSGEIAWLNNYSKTINYMGKPADLVMTEDISDKIIAEQKLKESEEKFRTIAEQAFMGIMIIQDDKLKYVNTALLDIFGFSSNETDKWTKEDITRLIHPEDLEFLREYRRNLREGVPDLKNYYSYRTFTKNGKLKWIDQFSKNIIFNGEPAELITIIDITEKKEAEEGLIKLNKLKSELFVRTSHELKTPLVSIKGFSDLLLTVHRANLDDFSISKITVIKNSADRLHKLIGDILKAAELESGHTEIKTKLDNLSQLIFVCIREVQGFVDLRNHDLEIDVQPELITHFEQEQIHKVISNLLQNAIKYTPPNGKIKIISAIRDDAILTSIEDNGIGFTTEEKLMIFKQFGKIERYGQNLEVVQDGTGLGLFISKKMVELHGGKIWVESEGKNQGSTFYFTLPLTKS